ncbi:MAG: phosphoribosylglycinamide formyltransferase, partial [Alphaproteobacteria bacterium]|nr:phosphoribosylglycinamide formyltransferase [Alphaproteobacteria bacterium]
ALSAVLAAQAPDVICLAGFMRILSPAFVGAWEGRILNIHPSLLPRFPGLDTHARALAAGETEHGCTVHVVTPALDAGPVLGRARVPVRPWDTPDTLAARVRAAEHRLYPAVLMRFLAGDPAPLDLPQVPFSGSGC